jgi:hypothetical protein
MLERLTARIHDWLIKFNLWLGTLPSTNFQVLISATLALTTALVYYVAVLRQISVDSVNFGLWLGFVAAYGGITYRQFAKKRDTHNPEMPSKQNTMEMKVPT